MNPVDCSDAARRYVAFFEGLAPGRLPEVQRYFTADARFRDPFNDVVGRSAIRRIFVHMFATTEAPAFQIDQWMCAGQTASIRWRFACRIRGRSLEIEGMSCVHFNGRGQVEQHIDYWDPASGIYERLPLVGALLRSLKRRFAAAVRGAADE